MRDDLVKQVVDAIFERVDERIGKKINNTNIELTSQGVVKAVSSDGKSATVDVGFTTTEYLPNYSGSTLTVGSVVKIYYDKPDMRDAYIGVRLTNKEATT